MRVTLLLSVAVASLAAACERAVETDCGGHLEWNGVTYYGTGTTQGPALGDALGEGVIPGCQVGYEEVDDEDVTVFAVKGVDPAVAVALEGFDGVYLAHAYRGNSAEYPPVLEKLILGPRCSEESSFVVEGDYVPFSDRQFNLEGVTTDAAGSAFRGLNLQFIVAPDADIPSVPLSRYGAGDRVRVKVHCREADRPGWTYVADEVSLVANGYYCGRYGEPCHRSEGPPQPAVAGGSAEQRALLGAIVEGVGPSMLRSVTVATTDRGAELVVEPRPDAGLRGEWETWLVAGAFRDRSHELGLPDVVGLAIGDERVSIEGGPWSGGLDDPRALSREVHRASGSSGVPFDEYALLQPAGVVPAITFRTSDDGAATFLKQRLPKFLEELGNPGRYEGFYFRVESPGGDPFWEWAGSSRLGVERTET